MVNWPLVCYSWFVSFWNKFSQNSHPRIQVRSWRSMLWILQELSSLPLILQNFKPQKVDKTETLNPRFYKQARVHTHTRTHYFWLNYLRVNCKRYEISLFLFTLACIMSSSIKKSNILLYFYYYLRYNPYLHFPSCFFIMCVRAGVYCCCCLTNPGCS